MHHTHLKNNKKKNEKRYYHFTDIACSGQASTHLKQRVHTEGHIAVIRQY